MGRELPLPPGYDRFRVGVTTVVAMTSALDAVREALTQQRTLHAWAATRPGATPLQGRATAWGARLPGSARDVVVRHAHHGGAFAGLTRDLFVTPGRAPWELEASQRLLDAGVATPPLVAYCLYPAGPLLCRSDVATERLPDGGDLLTLLPTADAAARERMIDATVELLRRLGDAGAHHADLNAKNVYVTRTGPACIAYAIDVDRVRFATSADEPVRARNLARLVRSLEKRRAHHGLRITDDEIARLGAGAAA